MNRPVEDRKLRIFISSTWVDLQPERQAVERALQRMSSTSFVGMEYFGSRPGTPKDACIAEIDQCDVYIGIFAHRYGAIDPESGLSFTQLEYRHAQERGLPFLIYFKDDNVPVRPAFIERDARAASRLEAFKDELRQQHTISFFTRPDDLATMIVADLHNLFLREELPAIKVEPTPVELLADRVRELLESMNFTIVQQEITSRREVRMLCEIPIGLGMIQLVLIGCVEGEITASDVETFEVGMRARMADSGMLIAYTRIASSAYEWAKASHGRVQLYTLDEFYRQLVDFKPCLSKLLSDYEKTDIPHYYVNLACTKPYFDEQGRLIGEDRYYPIDHYVDAWLEEPGRNHISILSNTGTGKTWFCWHYAARQAKRHLADPEHQRIPVFIPLREYAKAMDIRQLITDALINRYGVNLAGGYRAFERINADGRLLLIFDGFDEMVRMVDYQTVVENFWELAKVVVPNSKVLLTCRTHYFRYDVEARKVLGGEETGRTTIVLSRPNFEIVYLQEFNEEQISAVLQKRLGDHWQMVSELIQSTYDLSNLAQRPAMLSLLAETLPQVVSLPRKTSVAALYESYTGHWIQKNIEQERTFMDAENKQLFMQELAWQMYEAETVTLHYSQFPELVRQHFGLDQADQIDYFAYDLRAQSCLIRDSEGNYSFAHMSFAEYFVAKKLADVLERGAKDREFEEAMSVWGSKPLSSAVAVFLRDLVDPEILWMLIEETRGKTFEQVKYAGGNAATVLGLQGETLAGRDLTRTVLAGARLAETDIARAKEQDATVEEPPRPMPPSFHVPETLVRALRDDRCVVFVGSGVSVGAGLPDWDGFLQRTIENLNLDAEEIRKLDYYTLFQICSLRSDSGRFEVVEQLIAHIDVPTVRPAEAHRLIANLPVTRYATTNYDTLLDQALVEAKGNVRPVVSKYDLPYASRVKLLKLHGDIKQVGSLVITRDDYLEHREQEKEVFETLRNWLNQMPSLFLGFSHRDPDIMSLIDVTRLSLRQHLPPIYTVELEPPSLRVEELKSKGITPLIISVGREESKSDKFLAFLRFLTTCLQTR
jgi:hypothetical protein